MLSNTKKNILVSQLNGHSNSVELLGCGSSGEVYKVDNMVIKKMKLSYTDKLSFEKELAIWKELSVNPDLTPFIPKFLGGLLKKSSKPPMPNFNDFSRNRNKYNKNQNAFLKNSDEPDFYGYIIQEFEPVISLFEYISYNKMQPISNFEDGHALFNNLIRAFKILHLSKYIHRDIKPENILIRTTGEISMPIIIDFGMACKLPCDKENHFQYNNVSTEGTPMFLPQNVLIKANRECKNFPVILQPLSYLNRVKKFFCCGRRRPTTRKLKTTNRKIKGIFNVASDNYALGLTLEELFHVINWEKNPSERGDAIETIARLKGEILPYLTATAGPSILRNTRSNRK
jgi:serine/threonine protein kinase